MQTLTNNAKTMLKYITMTDFRIKSSFKPIQDQKNAINKLFTGLEDKLKYQVLLGVTGSGKTFTVANLIEKAQLPTLVISHNKTLAAQLYQEFKSFFPHNAVSYFVSYYDYYQPEAYLPQTDTYIDKEAEINEDIDKLRLGATANLLSRRDTIIVASVSCIYNLGSPEVYGNVALKLRSGQKLRREQLIKKLVDLQYQRSDFGFKRSTFRIRGNTIDVFPSYEEVAYRIEFDGDIISSFSTIEPVDGHFIGNLQNFLIYPSKHYMAGSNSEIAFTAIQKDLEKRVKELKKQGKSGESDRLIKKVNYDLEIIREVGYVNGIENYSRYFDGRNPGEPPFTLLDYFRYQNQDDWLLVVDESHMSLPQIRGMYHGDRSRKTVLIEHGFRLPSALDNRPLTFTEFLTKIPQTIFVSATPDEWEISRSQEQGQQMRGDKSQGVTEQLIRPTGIIDPKVTVKPIKNQIQDLVKEIFKRKKRKERVLCTTLTKKMAEELTTYLNQQKYLEIKTLAYLKHLEPPKIHYLHSEVETLVRSDILDDLRSGKYDVLIGINLLREGLDLPEVSLVAILDADKEGFLRSATSLVQTMGRAARHTDGEVIMYADRITNSMQKAIEEISRRRIRQSSYNKKYAITPTSIVKPIRDKLIRRSDKKPSDIILLQDKGSLKYDLLLAMDIQKLTPFDKKNLIIKLEKEMKNAANILNFELAISIREKIKKIEIS